MKARILFARSVVAMMLVVPLFAQSPEELAATASGALKAQHYPEAEKCYRELVRIMPQNAELHSNLGLSLFYQNRPDQARAAFQNALRLKPSLFVPNFFIGRIYFDMSRYPDALDAAKAALHAQPNHRESRLLLGASLVGLSRYDEAIALYRALAGEDPREAEAYYGLGLIYMDLGRKAMDRLAQFKDSGFISLVRAEFYAERPEWSSVTTSQYHEALSRSAEVPGLRTRLGMYLLKMGRWDDAATSFQEELHRDPYSYEAHFGLAALRLRVGDVTGSVRELNAAAGIRPQFFDRPRPFPIAYQVADLRGAQADLERQAGEGNFGAAYLLAVLRPDAAGSWPEVAEKLRKQLLESIASPAARPATIGERRKLGLECVRRKRYEQAADLLSALPQSARIEREVRTALARALFASRQVQGLVAAFHLTNTTDPEILYLIGDSYKQLAEATLQHVIELNPESARAHRLYGDSLVAKGFYNQAAKEYEAAAKIEPLDGELLYALGDAYYRLAAFDSEAETYRHLVELKPLDPQAHYMAGRSELHLQHSEEAIRLLGKALQLKPDLSQAEAQLGKAFALQGRKAEAIKHLERGAVADTDGTIHYQLSRLYRDTGDDQGARKALETFQKLREQQKQKIVDLTRPAPDLDLEAVDNH